MATKINQEERDAAIKQLRDLFPIGSTVRTVLRHVSRSGMTRAISIIDADGDDVSYLVARATGDRIDNRYGGIKVGGCGMDMGFALVYGLARTLYRDGFPCSGEQSGPNRCPANDHANEWRNPDWTPGRMHSDPGYALSHRWI
ncbi:hypothetical protein [Pseudonocardia sp. NPDC049154]|uniref:hypothetical protein n=1 Tax=Pseudonocardia sp. NPDC049154 TaxID=3155501 RepID=UPI0033EC9200